MAVDFTTLIKTAPFSEDRRQKIVANLNTLTEDQKRQLATTSWLAISQMYFGKLKHEQQKLLLEIRQGKKKFDKKDFENLEKKLTQEFAQKLSSAETEEKVEEVRQELQKHFRK
jgi:TRAP-type C4-dicarboxylate transport system substrate-binding protein